MFDADGGPGLQLAGGARVKRQARESSWRSKQEGTAGVGRSSRMRSGGDRTAGSIAARALSRCGVVAAGGFEWKEGCPGAQELAKACSVGGSFGQRGLYAVHRR